jgi:hypothetical protein
MLFAGIFRADASYIVYHTPERRGRVGGLLGEVHCFAENAATAHDDRKGRHYYTTSPQADSSVYSSDDPCGRHEAAEVHGLATGVGTEPR